MQAAAKICFAVLMLMCIAAVTGAATPREQLQSLTVRLQQAPTDNALRERIIRLAVGMKPAPTIPQEANRAFVRGGVFQQEAKDAAGYELAISAYRDALRSAPWWGDAYFNLAVALESAGKFDEAIVSLGNYMVSVPVGSAEAGDAQNKIYALEAKREIAAKQAVIDAQALAEKLQPAIDGTWVIGGGVFGFQVVRSGNGFVVTGEKQGGKPGGWYSSGVVADPQHLRFTVNSPDCPQCVAQYILTLSKNGNELTGTFSDLRGTSEVDGLSIRRAP